MHNQIIFAHTESYNSFSELLAKFKLLYPFSKFTSTKYCLVQGYANLNFLKNKNNLQNDLLNHTIKCNRF